MSAEATDEPPQPALPTTKTIPKSSGQGRVKCEFCAKDFSTVKHMRRHAKEFHFAARGADWNRLGPQKPPTATIAQSRLYMDCPICKFTGTKEELLKHYSEEHSIETVRKSFSFESVQQFELWKKQLEKETTSQFVKPRAPRVRKDGSQRLLYFCSRNGYSTSRSTKRRPMMKGSAKIQGYCPASLVVTVEVDGSVSVDYRSPHVGHAQDLTFIRLTNEDRNEIAQKIAQKIPPEVILDGIRETPVDNLERRHLITRQDIANIERSFSLLNPHVSTDSWVEEMRPSGLIRFYKGQNQDSNKAVLKREDFFLVIATEHQLDMLKKYGPKCIAIDCIHGLNGSGFGLTTILVLDEFNEGFPAAFLVSNRNDDQAMKLYFEVLAEHIGNELKTQVLLSDMAESCYNGWTKVFPRPQSRFFLTWLVERSWRENLKKIKLSSRQDEVNRELRTLLVASASSFKALLKTLTEKWMRDPDLREFGEYFNKEYKPVCQLWAFCYHFNVGINTNMRIERVHKTLNYIYLQACSVKTLDRTLQALVDFTRDKVFERTNVSGTGDVSTGINDLRLRHRTAVDEKFTVTKVGSGVWDCSSSTGKQMYRIAKDGAKPPCGCPLKCDACNACIHTFICSCFDSSIKWNMCKHIHYLCSRTRYTSRDDGKPFEPSLVEEDADLILSEGVDMSEEVETLAQCVPEEPESSVRNLEEYKKKVAAIWDNVKEELMSASSIEQIQTAEGLINSIIPTLRAWKEVDNVESLPSDKPSSSKKRKIES